MRVNTWTLSANYYLIQYIERAGVVLLADERLLAFGSVEQEAAADALRELTEQSHVFADRTRELPDRRILLDHVLQYIRNSFAA